MGGMGGGGGAAPVGMLHPPAEPLHTLLHTHVLAYI